MQFERNPLVGIILSKKDFSHREDSTCLLQLTVKTYRPRIKHILSVKWRKLYEIHLPDAKLCIRQFKMPRNSMNSLLWVVLWVSEVREVGTFCSPVDISPPILIQECYHSVS